MARSRTTRLSFQSLAAFLLPAGLGIIGSSVPCSAAEPRPLPPFERIVLDDNFPGAYQVEVADVNGDGKPDVVALGGGTCAWYQNPTWKKRIVTNPKQTPGIISTATTDLDGDGKAEIAIAYEFAMNQPTKGKLLLAHPGKDLDEPWTLVPVADVPSIHRLRWMRTAIQVGPGSISVTSADHQNREIEKPGVISTELVVAPIFGPSAKPPNFSEEPARLALFSAILPKDKITGGGTIGGGGNLGGGGGLEGKGQTSKEIDSKPRLVSSAMNLYQGGSLTGETNQIKVLHAITANQQIQANVPPAILAASNAGVTMTSVVAVAGVPVYGTKTLVTGAPGEAPKKGASEVHLGRLQDGRKFLATVEPWHGTDVAIYLSDTPKPPRFPTFGPRTVIDSTLKDGHALWVADVDGDGDDEVFAGYRGPGTSLIGYDFDGQTWTRTVIDTAIAAQDLRGGDLDGDGTPDFVGVGGSTHNVVWYRPKKD